MALLRRREAALQRRVAAEINDVAAEINGLRAEAELVRTPEEEAEAERVRQARRQFIQIVKARRQAQDEKKKEDSH